MFLNCLSAHTVEDQREEDFWKMVLSVRPQQQPKVHAGKQNARQGSKNGVDSNVHATCYDITLGRATK